MIAMKLFIPVIDLYVVGRLLFAVGYGVGTLVGQQSLRAIGFGMIVASIAILGAQIFEYDLLGFYKNLF